MSSFRWKRKFDNATDEYFNSHLPLKSTTSRVIYLVLQFINLIYDETELLDFTALALPAGKNLSATYGVYCERKHHCIETFLCIRVPSQQVMENCPAKQTNKQTNKKPRTWDQIFTVGWYGRGLRAPELRDLPGAASTVEAPRLCLTGTRNSHPRTPS